MPLPPFAHLVCTTTVDAGSLPSLPMSFVQHGPLFAAAALQDPKVAHNWKVVAAAAAAVPCTNMGQRQM